MWFDLEVQPSQHTWALPGIWALALAWLWWRVTRHEEMGFGRGALGKVGATLRPQADALARKEGGVNATAWRYGSA